MDDGPARDSGILDWALGLGFSDLGFAVWDLRFGIWDLGFGISEC
jgi:hypothetical protein